MTNIKILVAATLILNFKIGICQNNEFESDIIKVAIVASDLQATLDFYTNVVGLSKVREFSIDSVTATQFGFTKGVPFHVTCLKTKDSPQATEIKILSFGKNDSYKKPIYLSDNLGMQYMTFYMATVTPLINRLKQNNIKLLGESPVVLDDGRLLVLVQDPNGVFLEFIGKK